MPTPSTLLRGLRRLLLPGLMAIGVLSLSLAVAGAQTVDSPQTLQSLVNQTAAQFRLSYRYNAAEHQRRYEQLAAAVAAWRSSPRGAEENRRLADWLRGAIENSMPGSRQPLAAPPEFSRVNQPIAVSAGGTTQRNRPISSPTGAAPSQARSAADFWSDHPARGPLPASMDDVSDPFRDDPSPGQ